MTKYTLEIELRDKNYCTECPYLDRGCDKCRKLDLELELGYPEKRHYLYAEYAYLRDNNCPLKAVEDNKCELCKFRYCSEEDEPCKSCYWLAIDKSDNWEAGNEAT